MKRTTRRRLDLFWCRVDHPKGGNLGDEITPHIIEEIFGYHCEWAPPKDCQMAGAGSIIEGLLASKGGNRPALWGSGFITGGDNYISTDDFELLALRGKLTRDRVEDDSNAVVQLGDPGLLSGYLLRSEPHKKYSLGIIPHMADLNCHYVSQLNSKDGTILIDPHAHPLQAIQQIAECHTVLSSSLHGLIISDGLGVPNAHVKLGNRVFGGSYKFDDYYSIYNSDRHLRLNPLTVIQQTATETAGDIEECYVPTDDLEEIREGLINAFPN